MQEQAMIQAVLRHPMTPEGAKDVINTLLRQLDQARSIATLLEAECANCWGPIHKDAIEQVQALHRIEEATDVEG
jgi:hypothetical protein